MPLGTGGECVNNQTDDDPDRGRAASGETYERLVEVKTEGDPENLFERNRNDDPNG